MPTRGIITLDRWRAWCRAEQATFPNTIGAQMAAIRDRDLMAVQDIESTTVMLQMPNREEADCYSLEEPFILRVLDTPLMEFKAWQPSTEGAGWVLEPRWHVRVVKDPRGKAAGHTIAGVLSYVMPRTYLAEEFGSSAPVPLAPPAPPLPTESLP